MTNYEQFKTILRFIEENGKIEHWKNKSAFKIYLKTNINPSFKVMYAVDHILRTEENAEYLAGLYLINFKKGEK